MLLLIWRGRGLLVVVSFFPILASCAGLVDIEPFWICMLAMTGSLLLSGSACVYLGRRWSRDGTEHSFYNVPLQAWGWLYLAVVGLYAGAMVFGGVLRLIVPTPGPPDPRQFQPVVALAGGVVGFVVLFFTARALLRSYRPSPPGPPSIAVTEQLERIEQRRDREVPGP